MKLAKILVSILSAALVFVGCTNELPKSFDEINLSSSYIGIDPAGGTMTITVKTTDKWEISDIPDWLTVEPTTGNAGETQVTFTAKATQSTKEATIKLNCAKKQQLINVLQLCEIVVDPISVKAAKAIIDSGETPMKFVQGVIVKIQEVSPSYGNATYFIADSSSDDFTIQVYRGLYLDGKKFSKVDEISVGDKVIVYGKIMLYGGSTYEMDANNYIYKLEKSLIKVSSDPVSLEVEGGKFSVELEAKGEGINVEIPNDAKSWLNVDGIDVSGTKAVVNFTAQANTLGDRSTSLTFKTKTTEELKERDSAGKKQYKVTEYSAVTTVSQKGAIIETTADKINAAEDGLTQYRITGYVDRIASDVYGNLYIKDHTGEVYVYGTLDAEGKTKNFASLGIKAGDIITVVGPKSSYKGAAQMVNVTVEKHIKVSEVTVYDFLKAEVNNDVYYSLTGAVTNLKDDDIYGNFDLQDLTGNVYVYGVVKGWGGAKKLFQELGVKNGDIITIVGNRADYKGTAQVGNAFYVKHEKNDPNQGSNNLVFTMGENAFDDGVAIINGIPDVKVYKLGTSKLPGSMTVTVPAGATHLSFNAFAWKGSKDAKLIVTPEGGEPITLSIIDNEGVTGNSPYTITVEQEPDLCIVDFVCEKETKFKIETTTEAPRAVLFGFIADFPEQL